jgi:predicted metalloprotease with PDZ domain
MKCNLLSHKDFIVVSLLCVLLASPSQSADAAGVFVNDRDTDGLEDTFETKIGTNPTLSDTDGDGLSDFEEYCKYYTNPLEKDSDDDGISDSGWNERREYAYSIRAVCNIRSPSKLEYLNDIYQDARILNKDANDANTLTVELLLFPFSTPHVYGQPYTAKCVSGDMKQYLLPTISMNFSPEMQQQVRKIVGDSATDIDAINHLLHWINNETQLVKYDPHWEYFHVINEEIVWHKSFGNAKEDERFLNTNFLGDSMFKNKVHGTCSSLAILRASMFRAAGLPTRIIQTLPLITYYRGDDKPPTEKLSNRAMANGYEWGPGHGGANHMYNEVFLNNRWIRVDYSIEAPPFVDGKLFVKVYDINSFNNLKEEWNRNRCLRALEITDAYPVYKSEFTETDLSVSDKQLFIDRLTDGNFQASVVVHYKGVKPSPPFHICFYCGDPNNGGKNLCIEIQVSQGIMPNSVKTLKSLPFKLAHSKKEIFVVVDANNEVNEANKANNKVSKQIVVGEIDNEIKSQYSNTTSLPNIFVFSPSGLSMFKEILGIAQNTTFNKTQLSHSIESYNKVFVEGIYNKKPGDIILVLISLDSNDRVPSEYEDILPESWINIETRLKKGESIELANKARDLKVIVLAAPTKSKLKTLILVSRLLPNLLQKQDKTIKSDYNSTKYLSEPIGPVTYTVTIPENDWYIAKVTCEIKSKVGHPFIISMSNIGAPDSPGGYAYFMRNLTITDSNGNNMPYTTVSKEPWKIGLDGNSPAVLNYKVLLKHGDFGLPYGMDEAPYITCNDIFWTGRALFVIANMKDITVNFELPNTWQISTPWRPLAISKSGFSVPDEKMLTESFLFIGSQLQEQMYLGNTKILLAMDNVMEPSRKILQRQIKTLLMAYNNLFGETPDARILIVTSLYDKRNSFDGGVFGSSISMLFGDTPSEKNMYQWVPFLAHELFHLWNGQSIAHSGQDSWFSEGFTDYYALIVCARMGIIDEKEFLQRLERTCEHYYSKPAQSSISDSREYALQYAGGALAAACLDIQIRKFTSNKKSLDNLMQAMYQEFGKVQKLYSLKDIIRVTNDIAGWDINEFFEKYIQGTEDLPLESYFAWMGLSLKYEVVEELPMRDYVIHEMLQIQSLGYTPNGLVIKRSQNAGYQDEDLLVAINEKPVSTFNDIQQLVKQLYPGSKIRLTIIRDNNKLLKDMTLGGELPIPTDRKVTVVIQKQNRLDSNQKLIFYGILKLKK